MSPDIDQPGDPLGRALARSVDLVAQRPRTLLALVLAACLVGASYAASHLHVNADQDAMFSDELPHRAAEIEYVRRFPALYENIVVVVDAASADRAQEAAERLADRMASESGYFHDVYRPRNEFFEQHALLYMSTEELDDFADQLARVQPYLAGLAEDGTLRGLAMMLARGIRAAHEGDIEGSELEPILERIVRALRANLQGEAYRFSWAEVVAGRTLEADDTRRLIIAQPVLDFSELAAARGSIEALRRFARELGLDESAGVRVRVTGDVALSYEEMEIVEDQAALAGLASFVLVTGLLGFALRSWRLVIAIVCSLLAGLIGTACFAALAVGHLNLISIAFAVLFIGLAADFSLHLCMRYQELAVGLEGSKRAALREAAGSVGSSITLCAATTAIGFFAFVPTAFDGVAELGLIAGAGMGIGLVLTFSVVPAVLALGREQVAVGSGLRSHLPHFPIRYPRAVAVVAVFAAIFAIALVPRIRFDQNPLRVRDPSAESVQTYEELLSKATTSPWGMASVAPDLARAEALAQELRALDAVEDVETVQDYIPEDQDEKLAILEDASLFLAPTPSESGVLAPGVEEQLDALRDLDDELARLLRGASDFELLELARRLRAELRRYLQYVAAADPLVQVDRISALEESLVGSLPEQLETLERLLSAERITLEELPEGLRRRMISEDGGIRLVIHPAEDLEDAAALARFVDGVRAVVPEATGNAVNIYEASRAVVDALRQAFVTAVVVIALLLVLIWRTLGETLLVMIPLALAALLTSASAVLLGIPFNFADIIVLPLLLGIGVDSGIHLVHRSRLGDCAHGRLLETSTARAVVLSALTTIASFGSLAFATHRGMASLGQLLALGVTITAACNLIVLPALLELREERSERRRAG